MYCIVHDRVLDIAKVNSVPIRDHYEENLLFLLFVVAATILATIWQFIVVLASIPILKCRLVWQKPASSWIWGSFDFACQYLYCRYDNSLQIVLRGHFQAVAGCTLHLQWSDRYYMITQVIRSDLKQGLTIIEV